VLLLSLALGGLAWAQGSVVHLSPTVVVMNYGNETASIEVRNDSARPIGFKVQAYHWTNGPGGEPKLESTDEIIVFPAAIALQVGETRRIRIGTQIAAATASKGVERSYRIILDEVASASVLKRNGLATRMQFSLPVFVQAKDRTAHVSMPAPTLEGGTLRLSLSNSGRLHVTPKTIEARGVGASGAVVWTRTFRPWYLLSGEVRHQSAALTPAECRATVALVAEATFQESSKLSLREERKVPAGGCPAR